MVGPSSPSKSTTGFLGCIPGFFGGGGGNVRLDELIGEVVGTGFLVGKEGRSCLESPTRPTAPGPVHPVVLDITEAVPALRGGGIGAWCCVSCTDAVRCIPSCIDEREIPETLVDGRRGGMGLGFASVEEKTSDSGGVGEVEMRWDGFLATAGGLPLIVC